MEIERKFLIKSLPANLTGYPSQLIEQGYLCTKPVVRIRRQDQDYILTYKSAGLMSREEYNLPLTQESYLHLRGKTDGLLITKTRYRIPIGNGLTAELDVFHGSHDGLTLVEVEFPTEDAANAFVPMPWFGEEVTYSTKYHNSTLSTHPYPFD
ncbi:MAG: CYTH domain-containing protein [Blautia sp.]|jgi:adenylate cyclase